MDVPLFPIGYIYIYIFFPMIANGFNGISQISNANFPMDDRHFPHGFMAMSFLLQLQLSLWLGLGTCDVEQVALGMRFMTTLPWKRIKPMGKVWGVRVKVPDFAAVHPKWILKKRRQNHVPATNMRWEGNSSPVFLLCFHYCNPQWCLCFSFWRQNRANRGAWCAIRTDLLMGLPLCSSTKGISRHLCQGWLSTSKAKVVSPSHSFQDGPSLPLLSPERSRSEVYKSNKPLNTSNIH